MVINNHVLYIVPTFSVPEDLFLITCLKLLLPFVANGISNVGKRGEKGDFLIGDNLCMVPIFLF